MRSHSFNPTDVHMLKKIGDGSYSDVYMSKFHGQIVAVKIIPPQDDEASPHKNVLWYENELAIMSKLRSHEAGSTNVIQLIDGYKTTLENYTIDCHIIMEYASNGSLKDYMGKRYNRPLEWNQRSEIIKGMIDGLQFIHSHYILHLDIKSPNILLDQDLNAKIADFGLSIQMNKYISEVRGTKSHMAPEVYFYGEYSDKADIYSLGITILEIAHWLDIRRINQAAHLTKTKTLMTYLEAGKQLPIPQDCPSNIASIITECSQLDPKKRPSAKALQKKLNPTVEISPVAQYENTSSLTTWCCIFAAVAVPVAVIGGLLYAKESANISTNTNP